LSSYSDDGSFLIISSFSNKDGNLGNNEQLYK
jgi:hypothetical protein